MMLHLKDPKTATPKLLATINSYINNGAVYKINLQKSVAFLYTNNDKLRKYIGK
jgi:hypothetical protein